MRNKIIMSVLILFSSSFAFASLVNAPAKIETNFLLKGEISACALEKLLGKIQTSYAQGGREFQLELDSQGGDFGAAIAFVEALNELPDATFEMSVDGNGHQCSSACIPIFASGNVRTALYGSTFYIHGLDWHRESLDSKKSGPQTFSVLPEQTSVPEIAPTTSMEVFLMRPRCELGENRYRKANGDADLEGASTDYLRAVSLAGPELGLFIKKYIEGPSTKGITLSVSKIRKISPGFLSNNSK